MFVPFYYLYFMFVPFYYLYFMFVPFYYLYFMFVPFYYLYFTFLLSVFYVCTFLLSVFYVCTFLLSVFYVCTYIFYTYIYRYVAIGEHWRRLFWSKVNISENCIFIFSLEYFSRIFLRIIYMCGNILQNITRGQK